MNAVVVFENLERPVEFGAEPGDDVRAFEKSRYSKECRAGKRRHVVGIEIEKMPLLKRLRWRLAHTMQHIICEDGRVMQVAYLKVNARSNVTPDFELVQKFLTAPDTVLEQAINGPQTWPIDRAERKAAAWLKKMRSQDEQLVKRTDGDFRSGPTG